MANINGINSQLEALSVNNKSEQKKTELGQDQFFELMVAQMKNQDPLKPETNGDFLAQLAQFKTSDGIASMQKSLDALSSSLQSNQALQASALVGRSVLVPGDTGIIDAGGHINGEASLPTAAQNITMDIYSSNGSLVKRVPLGTHSAGDLSLSWDGTDQNNKAVAAGEYRMVVSGTVDGKATQFGTHIAANVDSVTLANNGTGLKLNVAGIGQVNLSDVKRIGE